MKCPLKEMDFCTGVGGIISLLLGLLGLGLRAGQGENELRVLASGRGNALVCFYRDDGTDGVGVAGMAETPDSFDLLWWEVEYFLDVEEGAERLDACGGFAGGFRCGVGLGRRWRGRSMRCGC